MITGPFNSSDIFESPLLSVLPDQKQTHILKTRRVVKRKTWSTVSMNYNVIEYLPDSGVWDETTIIDVEITPTSNRWKF